MAGELPDIEQEFVANVTRWLAGVDAMIAQGNEFIAKNTEMMASVDALQHAVNSLDGKTIVVDTVLTGSGFANMSEFIAQAQNATGAMERFFTVGEEGIAVERSLDEVIRDASNSVYADGVASRALADARRELTDAGHELGLTEEGLGALAEFTGSKMLAQGEVAATKADKLRDLKTAADATIEVENLLGTAAEDAGAAAGRATVWFFGWRISLTALHWIVSGTIEVLAVLIPALVAVGAAADVGLQGVTETADRMKSLYAVTESLGGAFGVTGGMVYGLKGNLQAAQDAADPQIWELLGEGVRAVGTSSGFFIKMGQDVLSILDRFGAELDTGLISRMGQVQSVVGDGARDLQEFGQVFGNLGMAIFSAASQMPGLAELLLGLLSDITRIISVVVQFAGEFRFMGWSILTVSMAIEEFMRWGGLLVSMLGGMGLAVEDLGPKFMSMQRFQAVFRSLALAIPNATVAISAGLSNLTGWLSKVVGGISDAALAGADYTNGIAVLSPALRGASGALEAVDGALVEASVATNGFSVSLEAAIAELSFMNVILGVGIAVGLGILIDKLITAQSRTQEWGDSMQAALGKVNVTQGMSDLITDLSQVSSALQIAQKGATDYANAADKISNTNSQAGATGRYLALSADAATSAYQGASNAASSYKTQAQQLSSIQKQQIGQFTDTAEAGIKVAQQYGVSLPEAFGILNTAGLHVNTMFQKNGQLTATAAAQVAGLVSGYSAMSGSALGLGNNVAAVNTQLGLQGSQLSKVNGAWDQFLANAIGGTQAYATLNDDISTMGNVTTSATSKITSFSQQSTGLSLSVKQISEALKSFGPQSSQVWQNYDSSLTQAGTITDWWRTAAASGTVTGKQMNQAIADTAKQLLPFTANSTTAASQLGVLVQEAGGPALTNYKALKTWIDANSTSQDAYNKLLGQTTTQMSNVSQAAAQFSQTMNAMVVTAVEQGSVNLGQITTDAKNYNNALRNNPPLSNAVQNSLSTLVTQLYNTNIGAQNVKTMVQQMGANMHLSAAQAHELAEEAYVLYENLSKIHNVSATVTIDEAIHTSTSGATGPIVGGKNYVPGVATGGRVPGWGGGDSVHAMLEPGEAIVPKHLVSSVAPFLGAHGVPGFAAGGVIPAPRGSGTGVGYQTPMEKVIAQWGGEVWANALKSWGGKGPMSLAHLKNVWGPAKFPDTGIWSNPQYRMLRTDERKDMDPYYLRDIAYQKVLGDIVSTRSAEAKQIATWKKDEVKGNPSETAYYTNLYKKDAAHDESQVAYYRKLLGQTTNAKLRQDYIKDIARYQADAAGYDKKAADEKNYYKNLYGSDIANLERSDARKVMMYQVEAANDALRMGYANGGMPFGLYDQGGYLPLGLSMALNTTGRPEPVGYGGPGGGGGGDQPMHVHLHMDGKEIAQTILPSVVGANSRYNIRNSGRVTGLLRPS